MPELLFPPKPELLLPQPHHRSAFWTLLIILDVVGAGVIACASILGNSLTAIVFGFALAFISVIAFVNHRHNHDHLWLMGGATLLTVLLAAIWAARLLAK